MDAGVIDYIIKNPDLKFLDRLVDVAKAANASWATSPPIRWVGCATPSTVPRVTFPKT